MKKIFLITFLIAFAFLSCKAQKNTITSSEPTINGISFLGNNVSLLTQHLGLPISIEDYYFEMNDVNSKKYNYNGILFYVINNKIDSFEITNNSYSFTSNNIKIGNNIAVLQAIYPLSFANKKNNGITLPFSNIDKFIIISYKNDLIEKIAVHDY
jgi:hypothetical protein